MAIGGFFNANLLATPTPLQNTSRQQLLGGGGGGERATC